MHKIMLVEDQTLLLGALSALLNLNDNIEVIAQCQNGQQAQQWLAQAAHLPDIILTDIEMPLVSGLELAEHVASHMPKIQVIIMTTFSRAGYIKRALNAGVKGFVLKESASDELIAAINSVIEGKRVIDTELALCALDEDSPLSAKESKALKLAEDGMKTEQIATQLFLSQGTVRNYLSEAIAKLHATNRIDAARIARQKGWL